MVRLSAVGPVDMKLIILVAPRLGLAVDSAAVNSGTRGLVGDTAFAVLPNISPSMTFTLTLCFQTVSSTQPFPKLRDDHEKC